MRNPRGARSGGTMVESELNRYRKVVKAKDGSVVVLRPMVVTDRDGLVALFRELPEDSRRLLKHDVTDESLVASWADELDYSRVFPLVAQVGDEIVADATLHLSLIHISEPTRLRRISYAVFCLKKKNKQNKKKPEHTQINK